MSFAAHFPGALVSMGSATTVSTANLSPRGIGREAGVAVAVHPSSHHNTLLFTRADYDRIFALLEPQVGWVPDTGHILRGRQSLGDTLAAHRDRIRYARLEAGGAEGTWAMLGAGICDVPAVIASVRRAPRFNGWVVVEEESATAASDPAAAVRANLETLRRLGIEGISR
jgi:sugar phosphate isomerase/epimerase